MEFDQADTKRFFKELFEMEAEWRRRKAVQYPDDDRNVRAAELLERLAGSVETCSPEALRAADLLFQDADHMETWSYSLRQVGFHGFPSDAEDFLRDFVEDVRQYQTPPDEQDD